MKFSVVIPVYKNEASIPRLLEALSNMSLQLDGEMEAVFVVDGSPDQSFGLTFELIDTRAHGRGIVEQHALSVDVCGESHVVHSRKSGRAADHMRPDAWRLRKDQDAGHLALHIRARQLAAEAEAIGAITK